LQYAVANPQIDPSVVSLLIEQKADINEKDGHRPLVHLAYEYENFKVLQMLLKQPDIDKHAINECGHTLLTRAAMTPGKANVIQLLLSSGVSQQVANSMGKYPIHCAIDSGDKDNIKALLKPLSEQEEQEEESKEVTIIKSVDIQSKEMPTFSNKVDADIARYCRNNTMAPLHHAAKEGNIDVVHALIQRRAAVNVTAQNGYTPLHFAVSKSNNREIIIALRKAGARIDFTAGEELYTPIHLAIKAKCDAEEISENIKALLEPLT
jgi:ankyrin repeat protein